MNETVVWKCECVRVCGSVKCRASHFQWHSGTWSLFFRQEAVTHWWEMSGKQAAQKVPVGHSEKKKKKKREEECWVKAAVPKPYEELFLAPFTVFVSKKTQMNEQVNAKKLELNSTALPLTFYKHLLAMALMPMLWQSDFISNKLSLFFWEIHLVVGYFLPDWQISFQFSFWGASYWKMAWNSGCFRKYKWTATKNICFPLHKLGNMSHLKIEGLQIVLALIIMF